MTNKKVLILSASPRKEGNSDILCDEFTRGATEAGHEVEKISLYDKKIGYCQACYYCFESGHCILKDDMEAVLDKMQAADVWVIATPTYFRTMNGMLKNTIDRFLPKWKDLGGHDVYFIITGHDQRAGLQAVEDELTTVFAGLGNELCGTIWGEGVWKKGEVLTTAAMEEAHRRGRNIE